MELLAQEKGWWIFKAKRELAKAKEFLSTFEPEPPKKQTIKPAETPSSI